MGRRSCIDVADYLHRARLNLYNSSTNAVVLVTIQLTKAACSTGLTLTSSKLVVKSFVAAYTELSCTTKRDLIMGKNDYKSFP
jgi:hypothetical protein